MNSVLNFVIKLRLALLCFPISYFLFQPIISSAEENQRNSTRRCVDSNRASVPECPNSSLLSEQYPIAAVSVSTQSGGARWAANYLREVFEASPQNELPVAYVSASESEYSQVLALLRAESGKNDIEKWLSQIQRTQSRGYNWQQDFYESFHNPRTGRPVLRQVVQDTRVREQDFQFLSDAMRNDCASETGPQLRLDSGLVGGMNGGNLEAVGDFCIIGRDHFESDSDFREYSRNVCGEGEVIEAPSQFLTVGHTDEFYKTIPIPGRSPPCNFAMMIGSPRKAMELLRQNPDSRVFQMNEEDLLRASQRQSNYPWLCRRYRELIRSRRENPPTRSPTRRGGGTTWLEYFLYKPSRAGIEVGIASSNNIQEDIPCTNMKNSDLYQILNSAEEIKNLNDTIQSNMDQFITHLRGRISARYPGCNPDIIEAPQVYYGANNFNSARATSIFPNLTNGESVNATYIMPSPVNAVFGRSVEETLHRYNIQTREIDTSFAHMLNGNLHCSSHAIRYCRPKEQR